MKAASVVLGLCLASHALAENKYTMGSGNQILEKCGQFAVDMDNIENMREAELADGSYCLGWVSGVAHMNNFDGAQTGTFYFCTPTDVTTGQMLRVLFKYLKANPEKLDQSGIKLTIEAYNYAWPCQGGPAPTPSRRNREF